MESTPDYTEVAAKFRSKFGRREFFSQKDFDTYKDYANLWWETHWDKPMEGKINLMSRLSIFVIISD